MTIGWDRTMTAYEKPKDIPPERIAVEATIMDQADIVSGGRRQLIGDNQREIREEIWF